MVFQILKRFTGVGSGPNVPTQNANKTFQLVIDADVVIVTPADPGDPDADPPVAPTPAVYGPSRQIKARVMASNDSFHWIEICAEKTLVLPGNQSSVDDIWPPVSSKWGMVRAEVTENDDEVGVSVFMAMER
jgi:hypothetical protein